MILGKKNLQLTQWQQRVGFTDLKGGVGMALNGQ
jgi:hypothetical protein